MSESITINIDQVALPGDLNIPAKAKALVLFVHGSGSSRLSPRNCFVAQVLNDAGIATLLIDLLSKKEDQDYETRFDIPLLTKRVQGILRWLEQDPRTSKLSLGLFGASTGAASMIFAAIKNKKVKALVSRGGRVDLAVDMIKDLSAPLLLIVGEHDFEVLRLNKRVYDEAVCEKKLTIIDSATHLFEEEGTLEQVADIAKDWFLEKLSG